MDSYQYKILIGGIGDDAHSVGIGLLALGFQEEGFFVRNLGIRNRIETFFEYAGEYDIILVSNKNGHSELFLSNFPRLMAEFGLYNDDAKLWYLGGSLSVNESDFAVKKKYLNMGFTNVYPKPIVFANVLHDIMRDVHRHHIPKRYIVGDLKRLGQGRPGLYYDGIINRKWEKEELQTMRQEVARDWPTGRQLEEYPVGIGKGPSLHRVLWSKECRNGPPLFQPRTGVADIEEQISLLRYLEIAGSDISSVQLDASSRSRFYDKAQMGRDLSIERKSSVLNGFPIPVYGVYEVRRLVTSLKTPFQLRGGGPDHRFTYEIALNAGISGVEGGFICYLLPYDKLCSPLESLRNWQYVDRLCSFYHEQHGVMINREYFGVLTATLIEPSIPIVVNIIQSLLSAQQGIKSITIGYAEQGNRSQDIAAMQVMREMVSYYLKRFNYHDCKITTVFHQYMAAFPSDYAKASELIFNSSITATLSAATKVMVKTAVEAIRIPDKVENGKALALCKKGALSAHLNQCSLKQIAIEKKILMSEVRQIMDVILELGNNSIAVGAIKAIEQGIIDIPWSPNIYNANKVMGVRDASGAIRFVRFGEMPFNSEVKDFHQEKVELRKMMERDSRLFSLLEKDLSRIWMNDYRSWPLDDHYVH